MEKPFSSSNAPLTINLHSRSRSLNNISQGSSLPEWCTNSRFALLIDLPPRREEEIKCSAIVKEDCNDETSKKQRQLIRRHCPRMCKKLQEGAENDCKCVDSIGKFYLPQRDGYYKCSSNFVQNNCDKESIRNTCPETCKSCPDSLSSVPSTSPSAGPLLTFRIKVVVSAGQVSRRRLLKLALNTVSSFMPKRQRYLGQDDGPLDNVHCDMFNKDAPGTCCL